ncbi:MAG: helix-turn-helix transcriptional regulator [Clostridiales bacterium]|nr:helix-turn-helix transcriptional regulator [Clostridiales bacterium]
MAFDVSEFGRRVRRVRRERGMAQYELAAKAGVSVSFLGHIERGTRVASIATLYALSEALGVTTDFLLKGCGGFTDAQRRVLNELREALEQAWLEE